MKPKDIARLVTLGPPTLAPDGRQAVVAATGIDLDENEYRSSLWIVATDGSAPPRRLTYGTHDSEPHYSPDGAWLALLAKDGDEKPQLRLLPTDGGEARVITDLPLGAGSPRWSPDSSAIAFVARVPDTDRYGTNELVPPGKEAPRRITGLTYRLDDLGFLTDRRSHVHVVQVAAVRRGPDDDIAPFCRQVTTGDADDSDVRWTSDGRLLFLSARHDNREHDRVQDVFVVDRDGTGQRKLTDGSLSIGGVRITDDPRTLLVAADPYDRDAEWLCRNVGLWRVEIGETPATPIRLTDAEAVHLTGSSIVLDGDRALVLMENRGAVDLVSVGFRGETPSNGSGVTTIAAGRQQITAIDRAGGVLVATYADTTTSGELARIDGDELVPLTDFGADARAVLRPITEIEATAPDGHPVHGFLAVPDGDGPHPVLLMIHGGPFAQYGWTNLDEAQVYAAAGYAVVYGNPRGSSGYGEAHGRYIVGDVGPRQTPDLMALLDAALERRNLDASRVGVLGGSHGGYMTTWLVGHVDRFRAAVSERAVNAIDSFEGSSDIGWDFADALYGTDPEQRRAESPLTYAGDISTPLLIVHSEQDWRCPVEQAQRLYVALRKRDAEVEMLLFPGEGHELSRSGVPSHRIARFDAILEWFGRYLA